MALSGVRVRVGSGNPSHFAGLVGPAAAAAIVTAMLEGTAGLRDLFRRMFRWRVRPISSVAAVASPIAILLAVLLVSSARGTASSSPLSAA